MLFCWIFFAVAINVAIALPEYHQNDYDVKFERAEILWYNHDYAKNVSVNFPFYKRITRMFNASGYLLHDMTSTELVIEIQLYKFLSMEYRYFPLAVSANVCVEYANINFNAREFLKNISNLTLCPLKKGYYYVHSFVPDYSRLPPFIPRGRYKNLGKLYYNKQLVGEAENYFEIMDKPLKWIK